MVLGDRTAVHVTTQQGDVRGALLLPSAWMDQVAEAVYEFGKEGEPVGPWGLHLEEFGKHVLAPLEEPPPKLTWLHPFEPPAPRQLPRLIDDSESVLLFRAGLEAGW